MHKLLHTLCFFTWLSSLYATSLASNSESTDSSASSISGPPLTQTGASSSSSSSLDTVLKAINATCASRTANYITHTLPQQCLRTGRTPTNSSQSSNSGTEVVATGESTAHENSAREGDAITATVSSVISGATNENKQSQEVSEPISYDDVSPTLTPNNVIASYNPSAEQESDSALDNANFLSFEEWKKQNLAKAGQSPDHVGRDTPSNAHRQRPDIGSALDTLGEESEINLDFSGFGSGTERPDHRLRDSHEQSSNHASENSQTPATPVLRSKDAGKTCKERTNYASFDCAATVLKTNSECKSASSILIEHKDSYMLNPCSVDNKFFIVELCNDILIDTVVLANYEFFSSGFRHFRLSVSDRYPVKMEKWKDLGTFQARGTREIQAFLVENPLIWARYLRVELLSHYGSEYYCPISLLRVHGTTMLEEFRHQEELARGEDDEDLLEVEVSTAPPVAQEPTEFTSDSLLPTVQSITSSKDDYTTSVTSEPHVDVIPTMTSSESDATPALSGNSSTSSMLTGEPIPKRTALLNIPRSEMTCAPDASTSATTLQPTDESSNAEAAPNTSGATVGPLSSLPGLTSSEVQTQDTPIQADTTNSSPSGTKQTGVEASAIVQSQLSSPLTSAISSASVSTSNVTTSNHMPTVSGNSTRASSSQTSAHSQPSPQPPTQESFFKSVSKRLQQLESNSTLSLQYIEEQSRILRDAFSKVEKRQLATTSTFLSSLNDTVMTELRGFRQAYDQLWQSTVIELEGQREQYQREMLVMSSRLTMMADELLWQKRLGIIQSTMILLCLALVLFGGRSATGAIEVPLMQQMVNRSSAALRAGWESPPNSASPEGRSPVSLFRRKLWRSHTAPDAQNLAADLSSDESREGPEMHVEPPTPSASEVPSDGEDVEDEEDREVSEEDLSEPEEMNTDEASGMTVPPDQPLRPPDRPVLERRSSA